MKISDLFDDYKKENIGTKICIELEVAHDDAIKINKQYSELGLYLHRESSKICEVSNVHLQPTETRIKIYNTLSRIYKNKFPVGHDTKLSGGCHFHTFFKTGMSVKELEKLSFQIPTFQYVDNFSNLPLFAKSKGPIFMHRPFSTPNDEKAYLSGAAPYLPNLLIGGRSSVGGIRQYFRTHDQSYPEYKSIEFRCNDNIDTRLFGYFIGQLLLAEEGKILTPLSKTIDGISERYTDHSTYKSFDDLSEVATVYSNNDLQIMRDNLSVMLKILRKNGFKEAAKQLRSYCKYRELV